MIFKICMPKRTKLTFFFYISILFSAAPDKKLDMRGRDLFLQRPQNWWSDCMFDTSLTMVSARIAPLCSTPADVSPLYFRRRSPPQIHLSLVQEPGGTLLRRHTHRERRFISQRDNDFILESISLTLNWVATASSRFCLDCAAPPVIYSGTISALSEKRIRESRARAAPISSTIHRSRLM